MFAAVLGEALARLSTVKQRVRAIRGQELSTGGDAVSRSAKGLVFVENYAVYEYVVVRCVDAVTQTLNRRSLELGDLRPEILALVLDPEFMSIAENSRRVWQRRAGLMRRVRSRDVAQIRDGLFPSDGSHFRCEQLETVWTLFGVGEPVVPDRRLMGRIDEMVEHRNAIAHGRDAPESVGGRYSVDEIEARVDDIEIVCTHVVSTLAEYCMLPGAFR